MTLRAALAAVGLVALLGSATAHAAATQSLDSVRAAAEQAMQDRYSRPGSRVVVSTEPLDTRLQLDACSEPLRALVSEQAQPRSRMTVPVQCPQPGGWIVRVPIQLQVFRQVLVSSRALLRGDGIGAADVHVEERDVTRLGYGYLDNLEQIAGRTLSRALARGSVLSPGSLGGRRMVQAGDHVQVLAQLEGISVRAEGVALGSGDNGARLRVRNAASGRVIDAMVSAPGVVVALP